MALSHRVERIQEQVREEVSQMLQQPNMRQMVASAALDRKLRDRLIAIATGEVVQQAREEIAMDRTSDQPDAPSTPEVLPDVATGGVTTNSVFEDVGTDPSSATGTSSVEQATSGDYGQRSSEELDEEAGSAHSNER